MISKIMQSVPIAYIGTNKNRLKVYELDKQIVFLNNNQEFQIELYNPTQNLVGAKIWLNNKLTSSSLLVIKPGERIWLDRYIDDQVKYLFETYDVEDTEESKKATEYNGVVKVEFFKEIEKPKYQPNIWYGNTYSTSFPPSPTNWTTYSMSDNATFTNNIGDTTYGNFCSSCIPDKVETGRVEKGSSSDQELSSVFYDFENYSFSTTEYKILPNSKKNIITQSEIRKYCTSCGIRIKRSTWIYCPTCGERL